MPHQVDWKTFDPMSHRKATKRRRELAGDDDFSPSFFPQKKRSKSQEQNAQTNERLQDNLSMEETETGVRRSSRTPKPKVFDDEETAVISRSSDVTLSPKPSDFEITQSVASQPSNKSKLTSPTDDAPIAKKPKKISSSATFDEGHKRETRRSYQSYLKEIETDTEVFKDAIVKVVEDRTPKLTENIQKDKKETGSSKTRIKKETQADFSPKVRTSSRTPVPKRIFSLLEEGEKEEKKPEVSVIPEDTIEPVHIPSTSPKMRVSSRAHLPKKSFHLLEKDDVRETKQDVIENSRTRTPKVQGSKKSKSKERRNDQELLRNTPENSDEPSPKIRISSRGHMPKRTFSLLEGDEDDKNVEENRNQSPNTLRDDNGMSQTLTEFQITTVDLKEPKRRRSSSNQQLNKPKSSPKEEVNLFPDRESEVSLSTADKLDVSKSISVSIQEYGEVYVGRKKSEYSKDDQDRGKMNKRKGKPVKKKIMQSEEVQMATLTAFKVRAESDHCTGEETSSTPKPAKPKSTPKVKQADKSSTKKGSSVGKGVMKEDGVENKLGFSQSDIVTSDDNSASDLNAGASNVKRKGKIMKSSKQKASKHKDTVSEELEKVKSNHDSEDKGHEHIILKLQLPQSEDGTKHKKHHHHHHHHHKHKQASRNHKDGSPKTSHHKKPAAKLHPDGSQTVPASEKNKKKISIKFKGLSNSNVEMVSNALEQSSNTVNLPEQSKEGNKKKKKQKLPSSQNEKHLASPSQTESEHVKLVIKKEKIPTSSKSDEVKKKKNTKPTTLAVDHQKKKGSSKTESKKETSASTSAKRIKSPQVGSSR